MWVGFVELIRAGIFAAAHLCNGSLGGGVLVVSFVLRLGLLPLTLLVAAASAAAAGLAQAPNGQPSGAALAAVIAASFTLLFLASASSTLVLSVGAGSAVSGLQAWLLARDQRRETTREHLSNP